MRNRVVIYSHASRTGQHMHVRIPSLLISHSLNAFVFSLIVRPDHLAGDERELGQKPTQPMEWCQEERTLSMRSLVCLSLDIVIPSQTCN